MGVAITSVGDPLTEVFATRAFSFATWAQVGVANTGSGAMSTDVFKACTHAPVLSERVEKAATVVAVVDGSAEAASAFS